MQGNLVFLGSRQYGRTRQSQGSARFPTSPFAACGRAVFCVASVSAATCAKTKRSGSKFIAARSLRFTERGGLPDRSRPFEETFTSQVRVVLQNEKLRNPVDKAGKLDKVAADVLLFRSGVFLLAYKPESQPSLIWRLFCFN